MSKYPEHISPEREPKPTPTHIVEDGKAHFGTFDAPFENLNLRDVKKPCGPIMPNFMKPNRLVEWEAVEVSLDEGVLVSAVYRTGIMGFSIFVWYDREQNKIYSWRNIVLRHKAKVAAQLISDNCKLKTKRSEYVIENDLGNGKAYAKGYSQGKNGYFSIDVALERIAPPSVAVMPLSAGKNGELRHPLYSEKDLFKAKGNITVGDRVFTLNERSLAIIDDHKGYYPYSAHYDWLTTMSFVEADGKKAPFSINLTRNQSVDQHRYNENCIWTDGRCIPLPPVVFTHEDNKRKAKSWHITDETGKGLVDVTFTLDATFYMPIHAVLWYCYYALPFGKLSGYVTDTEGNKICVDGMTGIGEDKTTRM